MPPVTQERSKAVGIRHGGIITALRLKVTDTLGEVTSGD
jgi:hypothetical protein